jgi:hypothetical protein
LPRGWKFLPSLGAKIEGVEIFAEGVEIFAEGVEIFAEGVEIFADCDGKNLPRGWKKCRLNSISSI